MYILIILFVFTAVTTFLIRRKHMPPKKFNVSVGEGYGLPMTDQEIELEHQSHEAVLELLEARMISSGFFRAEKIPELIAKLRGGYRPFCHLNTKVAFDGSEILTIEEKKMLGLSPRMKYSRSFIEYFDPIAFKQIEPKETLLNMYYDADYRVWRKKELRRLKELGVRQVKISPCGDARDCGKIKRLRKTYRIDEVPDLPLPGCTAPYCRCIYLPIIKKDT